MWSGPSNPEQLAAVARDVDSHGTWRSFITPQEHRLCMAALAAGTEAWALFLDGKLACQLRLAAEDGKDPQLIDVDSVALAFRIRYMIWERAMFGDSPVAGSGDDSKPTPVPGPQAGTSAVQRHEEDDYDDFDEEELAPSAPEVPEVLVVDATEDDAEPDPQGQRTILENYNKMYHTFDTDSELVAQFERLEASDRQVQRTSGNENSRSLGSGQGLNPSSGGSDDTGSGRSSFSAAAAAAQFGAANLSLKHLLATIESRRDETQITDVELRNLISDVRKNRSKWASEERIGQEELYEACEKVVQELRAYTEHSTAFLNKVNKRDAPNYYQIITKPMDLNTVTRKLRALQYNSKDEFVDDLMLIWQNCLTYNSDPKHFLRAHAIAMRKKTQSLTPLIPEVTIRSRAEVEREAKAEAEAAAAAAAKDRTKTAGKGLKRKLHSDSAPQTSNDPTDEEGHTSDGSRMHSNGNTNEGGSGSPQKSAKATAESGVHGDVKETADEVRNSASHTPKSGAEANGGEASTEHISKVEKETSDTPNDDNMDVDILHSNAASDSDSDDTNAAVQGEDDIVQPLDVESTVWQQVTKRRRIAYLTRRKYMFVDNRLQPDAVVPIRRATGMSRFQAAIQGDHNSIVGTEDGASEEPFLVEYEVASGVPPPPPSDPSFGQQVVPPGGEKALPPSRYVSTGIVGRALDRNLNEMQDIRRLCAKILLIRDMQQNAGNYAGPSSVAAAQEYPAIQGPSQPEISSRLPGAQPLWGPAANAEMRRVAAKLAMNTGFESAQRDAVSILGDIGGEYMAKLGETLVANLEDVRSNASFSSVLKGSLEDMGVPKLDTLLKHLSDDVFKQSRRLTDFRQRLAATLGEMLRPEIERYKDEQFNDNSDQFVLGQFSNELGDDYFGFKDLGLDKELGIANIAIPFHLLQQRIVNDASVATGPLPTLRKDSRLPEYPSMVSTSALPHVIGLLRPIFAQVANTGQSPSWARPKVPASGKLGPRKRHIDKAYVRHRPPSPAPEPPAPVQPTEEQPQHPQDAIDKQDLVPDNLEEHKPGSLDFGGLEMGGPPLADGPVGSLMLQTIDPAKAEQEQFQQGQQIDTALDEFDAIESLMR